MSNKTIYCVYLTTYRGNKLPMFYIGSTSIEKINRGYRGSVKQKKYQTTWNIEINKNPQLFHTKVIAEFSCRKSALEKEAKLQKALNVVRSSMYINQQIATKDGCHGMDVSGKNNPRFGIAWTDAQRQRQSQISKDGRAKGVLKPIPPMIGKKNGRYGSNATTYKTIDGTPVYAKATDPRVLSGELVGISSGIKSPKIGISKKKCPNIKKFSFFILEHIDGTIVHLSALEYGQWMRDHKIKSCDLIKRMHSNTYFKNYKIVEHQINPHCNVKQPIKKPKYKNVILKTPDNELKSLTYVEYPKLLDQLKLNRNKLYNGLTVKGYSITEKIEW